MDKSTLHLESFGISDIGLVREHNEDVWVSFPEMGLFLLADGMGGHAAGEIASQEAVDYFYSLFKKWNPSSKTSLDEVKSFFHKAMIQVNNRVYTRGLSSENLKGMGTTLATLFFFKDSVILAHVGDSRIYRQKGKDLEQLTVDHTLVSELLSLEAMKPEDAGTFPYKHILTRAIGTNPKVEPTVNALSYEPHDLFLLCSDGLTNYVTERELNSVLQQNMPLPQKAQQLIDLSNEHGGGDNITLILVNVLDDLSR